MERDRWMRETEKTEKEVVEYFKRWATIPEVREWINRKWMTPEEQECRFREIFSLSDPTKTEGRVERGTRKAKRGMWENGPADPT